MLLNESARAHGVRTYEPRQGRKAATVVCSAPAVVTLAFFSCWEIESEECRPRNSQPHGSGTSRAAPMKSVVPASALHD